MIWKIERDAAWIPAGSEAFRHYCGAMIERHGRMWTAVTATGRRIVGCRSAIDAVAALHECQSVNDFWHFKQFGHLLDDHFGKFQFGSVEHRTRPVYRGDSAEVFIFRSPMTLELPPFLRSALKRHFVGVAACLSCGTVMADLGSKVISEFDGQKSEPTAYLICPCGYPVWQMETLLYSRAQLKMRQSDSGWRRQQSLKAVGGKHSKQETAAILALQNGRCIYCDAQFTDGKPWDEDHIVPVSKGGSNWALNIVLACEKCNRRRGNMPFLTFCRLLNPAQNERILSNLKCRVSPENLRNSSDEVLQAFLLGIEVHDPDDRGFLDIQRHDPEARQNARRNRQLSFNACKIVRCKSG